MSKVYDFLRECSSFFVLTINGDYPAGRPFGALMEVNEKLYLSTSNLKQVYKQMINCGKIQIVAKKDNSREWIRITGIANECMDKNLKRKMIDENPVLLTRFTTVGWEHFAMFEVKIEEVEVK